MTSAASTPAEFEGEHRSARKRRAIIEAATTEFLSHGYLGTTMDEIAALARVSKQTVYKHFADKERLFSDQRSSPPTSTRSPTPTPTKC